ncbi:MAG: iron ABC transporter permease [Flavobacteriaceae bacterium]|jgi:iron complex transport system permease protein|nr:iron ABC transporter permease [Flavobacteriaceae bacterium]
MFKKLSIPLFCIILLFFFLMDLSFGTVRIPFGKVIEILSGSEEVKNTWTYIVLNYRLPKAIAAVLTGMALSVSGLMMQTLFRNPMAEAYVLGISSGASLAIAIAILGGAMLPDIILYYTTSVYGLVLVSIIGSMLLLLLILLVSNRVKNSMTILIVGLMFGSFSNAIVSILSYLSNAEQLKRYSLWMLGSLGNLSWEMIGIYSFIVIVGLFSCLSLFRTLDAFLLGDTYATSLGINVKKSRNYIVIVTSLLAGASTAFVGPIAFVGLAIPHIARLLLQTSKHKELFVACVFLGGIIMLICDILSQIKGEAFLLPINALTALFGAPIVIYLLLRKKV